MTTAARIRAMGTALGPDVLAACRALFDAEHSTLAAAVPALAADRVYGPHERHHLDLYGAPDGAPKPVLLFVHGGGFVQGDKGGPTGGGDGWPNANVGRMAAELGMVGAVMNYRLAPEYGWPAGAQDVGAAVAWLRAHADEYGGDPARIVVMGTSAGAVHVSGFLADSQAPAQVRGAVLLSGLYGYTPLDTKDERYYGDPALYPARMPRDAVTTTDVPLLVACAECDPPRFQAEFLGLLAERLERHGAIPRAALVSGHNHYTMAMHLGTSDRRLADEIAAFVKDVT